MRLTTILLFFFIVHVDLRLHNGSDDHDALTELADLVNGYGHHSHSVNRESLPDRIAHEESSMFNREKKSSSRKKVLDDDIEVDDEQYVDKPRRFHSSKTTNRSSGTGSNRRLPVTTTPASNYLDEASLCINEFDVKPEQLVKVKEFKNGAHMIRIVRIDEPSAAHGLDVRDVCMLNCCVEKLCDLAMLSEQQTKVSDIDRRTHLIRHHSRPRMDINVISLHAMAVVHTLHIKNIPV